MTPAAPTVSHLRSLAVASRDRRLARRVRGALLSAAAGLAWLWLRSLAASPTRPPGGGTRAARAVADDRATPAAVAATTRAPAGAAAAGGGAAAGKGANATAGDGDDDYDYAYDYSDYDYADCDEVPHHTGATLDQLGCARGCKALPKEGRRLYAEDDWARLRRLYREQGGKIGGGAALAAAAAVPDGLVAPIRPGQTDDGKGRGAFAARDIARGEQTYGGLGHYAVFRDGESFRRFLAALPDEEACDVLIWSWTQMIDGAGPNASAAPLLLSVLDDNALQNAGSYENAAPPNTGCPEDRQPCRPFDEFALRDIREGEELLCNYGDFAEDYWHSFGLRAPHLDQLKEARGCARLPEASRPLYAEEDWERLRRIYREQGGPPIKRQDAPPGFVSPLRVRRAADGRRAAFAARDVARGERTHGGERYAYFGGGRAYRRFVAALEDDAEACDVLELSWTQETPWQTVLLLALDDSALMARDGRGGANVGPRSGIEHEVDNFFEEFAWRDIQEGEELRRSAARFSGQSWGFYDL